MAALAPEYGKQNKRARALGFGFGIDSQGEGRSEYRNIKLDEDIVLVFAGMEIPYNGGVNYPVTWATGLASGPGIGEARNWRKER